VIYAKNCEIKLNKHFNKFLVEGDGI